jgi:glyoxylase-like metal-dependent hydrolase (beta-lactamase superfamily II)
VSFTLREKFRIKGWIDAEGQVQRVLTWVGDTDGLFGILGDMPVETLYSDYAEFDGLRFPRRIVQKWGGFPILEVTVDTVQRNAPVDIEVPTAIRDGSAQPFDVTAVAEEVAAGVWHVTGALWHSVAIEFDDHLVVVEAPFTAERSIAVLEELKVKAPGKPVKYVVNTHHHFDHSGGLRVYANRGAIVLTHEINLEFFERASTAPRTLAPDGLAKSGRIADFRPVADKMVLSDGARDLELYHLEGSQHAAGLLFAYLPHEKLLIEADIFDPVGPDSQPPSRPDPEASNLYENILHYNLDVDTIVPIHGRPVPLAELIRWVGVEAVERTERVEGSRGWNADR